MKGNKILGYSSDGTISYIRFPIERLKEALRLLERDFYPQECLCSASGISQNSKSIAELNLLATECIKNGASIAAIEIESNKLVGCSLNRIYEKTKLGEESFDEIFIREKCGEIESKFFMDPFSAVGIHIDIFEVLDIRKCLELIFLAMSSDYRGRNIGTDLIKYDLQLLDQLAEENGPNVAITCFTSHYSQKIGQKLKFKQIFTVDYKAFNFNGIRFSDKLDAKHKGAQFAVKFSQNCDVTRNRGVKEDSGSGKRL